MLKEQRKMQRRDFSYYMPVSDAETAEHVGIMTDISLGGFKLDSRQPIPNGQLSHIRLELSYDLAPQAGLDLVGRSKWCHPDYVGPSIYNVGFEIVNILPDDKIILQRVLDKYGLQAKSK
jgi:PilZ domain